MYSLRSINNMYAEHAGSRSDFIIVGHPEYMHGKVRSQSRGLGGEWDTKRAVRPQRCLAASRSLGTLVTQLSSPEPWLPLKEKSQRRLAMSKDFSKSLSSSSLHGSSSGKLHRSFDAFLQQIQSPEDEDLSGGTVRTPRIFAKKKRSQAVCRHFAARHDEISDIRQALHMKPDETQRMLKETGAWKYYALQLEQDQRLRAQFERDRQRFEPNVRKWVDPPPMPSSGASCSKLT